MARYLYIHIPFCLKKCIYCDFYSVADGEDMIEPYVSALCKEIEMRQDYVIELDSIYIGGGTPTVLKGKDVAMLMNRLRSIAHISPAAEITSEANPGTLTRDVIEDMLGAGINRISIGVQSLSDAELSILGRVHHSAEAVNAFHIAREGGFGNISLDLIYGIPGQDIFSWKNTLEKIAFLRPEHISTYELTPEKNTLLYEKLQKYQLRLPHEEVVTDMYYHTIDMLADNGYAHYEISNFALPGRECRHNLNYWNRGEYTGIGAGAHSFADGQRTANIADVKRYIDEINENRLPVNERKILTDEDRINEILFLELRKTGGIDLDEIPPGAASRLKKAPEEPDLQGLVELSGNHIRLTRKGLIFCNQVIVRLMLDIERSRPSE